MDIFIASLNHASLLFKLVAEIGLLKAILISLIILGLWLGIKYISQYNFNKKAEKHGIKVSDESDLRYNPLFNKGTYFVNYELPNLDIFPDKPIRRQLMIDLLTSHFNSILNGCKDIAEIDMKDWSSDRWTKEMTQRFNQMIYIAKSDARNQGVPEIAISRFGKWSGSSIDHLFTYIDTIGVSSAYSSNTVKTNTLFLIVNVLFNTMLGDAERTITTLNGDITGTIYKNNVVEPVDHIT